MSMQFGIWNFDGKPVDSEVMHRAGSMLLPYAPNGESRHDAEGLSVIHHALHITAESRQEQQPFSCVSGAMIFWDGRLDNRADLIQQLQGNLTSESSDLAFVAAAFERWGTECFAKLLGDWAIAIINLRDHTLILAKDIIGIRPLYYHREPSRVRWSTSLDPLILLHQYKFQLNLSYVAGWLGPYPATDATPYVGVCSVPPASFVVISEGKSTVSRYWDFDDGKRIRYKNDAEYEEHFRIVFAQAVRRRLRSDRPICAELSGGMDSSSVTCMADLIAATHPSEIPPICTLSYFDTSESNADDLPYFSKVEEQRGRVGCHIDITGTELFAFEGGRGFEALPSQTRTRQYQQDQQRTEFLLSNRVGVVLSGLGGDEVMGGVPTPVSELQDLLAQQQFRLLAHQLKVWALYKRKPWFHLLGEAVAGFFPPGFRPAPKYVKPAPWWLSDFTAQHRIELGMNGTRVKIVGALPSFQANLATLDMVRRQMATKSAPPIPPHERRHPYLDRDLLEFVFALPREQLLRPGYRRSLMRRALRGIVPAEVIDRRRKGFVSRGPRAAISLEWQRLSELSKHMLSSRYAVVDEQSFNAALLAIKNSDQIPMVKLMRTAVLEAWLRNLDCHHVLRQPTDISHVTDVTSNMGPRGTKPTFKRREVTT